MIGLLLVFCSFLPFFSQRVYEYVALLMLYPAADIPAFYTRLFSLLFFTARSRLLWLFIKAGAAWIFWETCGSDVKTLGTKKIYEKLCMTEQSGGPTFSLVSPLWVSSHSATVLWR